MLVKLLLLPLFSFAAILSPQGESHKFEDVSLSPKASLSIDGRSHELSSVGEGLRYKKVAFVKVRVYVGQLWVSDLSSVKKDKAELLSSLSSQKAVVMQMTFLRKVDAKTLEEAFRDSFKENKISMEEEAIQKFLKAIKEGDDALEGKTLTISGVSLEGKDLVSYESSSGKTVSIEGPVGFRHQVLSLWLGKAVDGGVENLQEGILK